MCCGAPANYSFRLTADDNRLLLGEKDHYEPRCRECFKAGFPENQP